MRILITGASGFLGARLVRRLQQGGGHELFVLPSPHFQAARLAGCRYRCVSEELLLPPVDLIYHLAGPSIDSPEAEHERAIVGGMRRLLDALPADPAVPRPRLVFAGSGAEYGPGHGWREDEARKPDTVLGRAKTAAAELARASSAVHLVHLRLFTPFGEGEARSRLIPSALRAAAAGEPIRLRTTGEQTRDYVDAGDVIEALTAAGVAPLEPGIAINISTGTPRRAVDVALRIAELAGRGTRVLTGPAPPRVLPQSSGDNRRAAEKLQWRPVIEFDASLRRLLASAAAIETVKEHHAA